MRQQARSSQTEIGISECTGGALRDVSIAAGVSMAPPDLRDAPPLLFWQVRSARRGYTVSVKRGFGGHCSIGLTSLRPCSLFAAERQKGRCPRHDAS